MPLTIGDINSLNELLHEKGEDRAKANSSEHCSWLQLNL